MQGALSSHVAGTFALPAGTVPANATAVTGNLTVTQQTSEGFLYLGPTPANNPTSSTLNFPVADDRANAVTVALGPGQTLGVTFAAPTLGPTAQVIFDLTGYFTPDTSGAAYVPITPARILDTRNGTGGLSTPLQSHVAGGFPVSGQGGVAVDATAVTGNLTVTEQTDLGFLYLGPAATNNPTSSTLNFPVGDDRANAVTVAVGSGGRLFVTYAAPVLGPDGPGDLRRHRVLRALTSGNAVAAMPWRRCLGGDALAAVGAMAVRRRAAQPARAAPSSRSSW